MTLKNKCEDKFDIIIVAGQSNASGCGKGQTFTPYVKDDRIMAFTEDFTADVVSTPYGDMLDIKTTDNYSVCVADERVENGEKNAVFCLSFAKKYLQNDLADDRKVLIVQTAIGGTGFARNHWGEDEKLEKRLYKMVDAALSMNEENRVVAVLWHQGEHDIFENEQFNYQERYDFYKGKLTNFITRLLSKYGNVPFISGSFCNNWLIKQDKEKVSAVLDAYKDAYKNLNTAVHVYDTKDLESNLESTQTGQDDVHFCRDASYKLGERYYEKYVEIKKEIK